MRFEVQLCFCQTGRARHSLSLRRSVEEGRDCTHYKTLKDVIWLSIWQESQDGSHIYSSVSYRNFVGKDGDT